jgi:hypothetical protein
MSRSLVLFAACCVCAGAIGQSFECYPVGALPMDPALGCEGVASNGLAGTTPNGPTQVTATPSCGFPTAGLNYLQVCASGPGFGPPLFLPFTPPVGGPFPRPADQLVSEVRIPIPVGASLVTMDWEFFAKECFGVPPGNLYYDGMSIDVVGSGGNALQNLLYVDTGTARGACTVGMDFCGMPMLEVVPNGPNQLSAVLPSYPNCEYISIVVWNGQDNDWSSMAYFDNIQFNSSSLSCPVPCFIPIGSVPTLAFSSPGGTGCVQVNLSNMPAGGFYFLAVTLQAGAFPTGWFFGIDISFPELQLEINAGFPFVGALVGSPCGGTGSAQIGPLCGLPSGLTVYAVGLGVPAGSQFPSATTNPATHTLP